MCRVKALSRQGPCPPVVIVSPFLLLLPFFFFKSLNQYYVDVRNVRATYVSNFIDNLINWDFVNSNLKA